MILFKNCFTNSKDSSESKEQAWNLFLNSFFFPWNILLQVNSIIRKNHSRETPGDRETRTGLENKCYFSKTDK